MMEAVEGSIVQITDASHEWLGCLLIVTEVKSFGIQGYAEIPLKGQAYLRVDREKYEVVGRAAMVAL